MTQKEAAEALIAGANNTDSTYLNVVREHLLIALGAQIEKPADGNNDDSDVQG